MIHFKSFPTPVDLISASSAESPRISKGSFTSKLKFVLPLLALSLGAATSSGSTLLFSHDFENATPGAVDAVSDLGSPSVGTLEFRRAGFTSNPAVGAISTTNPAFMLGHRNNATPETNGFTNMNALPNAASVGNPVVDFYTVSSHRPGTYGTSLRANLSAPAEISPGKSVNVSFDIGSFGNNNPVDYKIVVVTGLDAGGNSLFNIAYRAGSTSTTRELYVSNGLAGGTGSYISVDAAGEIGGVTKVLGGSSSNFNSTNAASAPSLLTVDLNLAYSEASMLDYLTVDLDGNGSTLELEPNINNQFEMDYAPWQTTYNSLVALDFTVVWNRNVDSQNKGLWLDNIVVQSIPEPTTAVMVLFAGLALFRRVRR